MMSFLLLKYGRGRRAVHGHLYPLFAFSQASGWNNKATNGNLPACRCG
jgi:hypothetical protein